MVYLPNAFECSFLVSVEPHVKDISVLSLLIIIEFSSRQTLAHYWKIFSVYCVTLLGGTGKNVSIILDKWAKIQCLRALSQGTFLLHIHPHTLHLSCQMCNSVNRHFHCHITVVSCSIHTTEWDGLMFHLLMFLIWIMTLILADI